MSTTMRLSPNENRLTLSQKGRHCGEIRFTFCVGRAMEINDEMRARAECELKRNPQHQNGYYDLLLAAPNGVELDFETNIV